MVRKSENFQIPAGEKRGSNEEFSQKLKEYGIEKEAYLALKHEYLDKKAILERTEKEMNQLEEEGTLSDQERLTARKIIISLKRELRELEVQIKHTAKKMSDTVTDPRFQEMRFEEERGDSINL